MYTPHTNSDDYWNKSIRRSDVIHENSTHYNG